MSSTQIFLFIAITAMHAVCLPSEGSSHLKNPRLQLKDSYQQYGETDKVRLMKNSMNNANAVHYQLERRGGGGHYYRDKIQNNHPEAHRPFQRTQSACPHSTCICATTCIGTAVGLLWWWSLTNMQQLSGS